MQQMLADPELELIDKIASFSKDPYGFVLYSFPWGEGELEDYDGPDEWQAKILKEVGECLRAGDVAKASIIIQEAVASGHGIGKSALLSWIIIWGVSTFEDAKGIVTANTQAQLITKTWAELAKWHRLFIASHWFKLTATALFSVDPQHEKTWRFDMIPWSENNTEAFAGLHNQGKRIILIFDEGSAIPNKIYEVAEGALTDANTQILWFVFGNPTRGSGRFFDLFHKLRHRWSNRQIDSRTAKMANKVQLDKWIEDYGIDSDFCKVRILGQFPNVSDRQFISHKVVAAARGRHLRIDQYNFAAKVMTLDNAWTGGDEIVISLRQGLAFKILATYPKNDDDFDIASRLAKFEDEEKADAVFIDIGFGTGVFSAGKQLKRQWTLVAFGSASPDPGFLNLRVWMWEQVKRWLAQGGAIPDDQVLCDDLTGPEYGVVATGQNAGKTYLESKEDMKKRGLASPNRGDGLALSFAAPVAPKFREGQAPPKAETGNSTYDPLS